MDPLLVFPAPPSPELIRLFETTGYRYQPVTDADEAVASRPATGWAAAIVELVEDIDAGWKLCDALRAAPGATSPIVVIVARHQLDQLPSRAELFDEFCIAPVHLGEVGLRLQRALAAAPELPAEDLLVCDQLVMNLVTYEASIDGRPLELTNMEYQLLKHLAHSPGRVFTREVLLSQVWGYDYFGGARTVDVHIRRLRAKLGEDHSALIQTVRSVGYTLSVRSSG